MTYQVAPPVFLVSKNDLLAYLETEILPRYSVLDVGHNQNHIYQVLKNAYALNDKLGNKVDSDLLTTAVVYHDLGVLAPTKEGRKKHGKGSGYASFDLPEAQEMVRARRELLWEISESFEKFDEYFAKHYDF